MARLYFLTCTDSENCYALGRDGAKVYFDKNSEEAYIPQGIEFFSSRDEVIKFIRKNNNEFESIGLDLWYESVRDNCEFTAPVHSHDISPSFIGMPGAAF